MKRKGTIVVNTTVAGDICRMLQSNSNRSSTVRCPEDNKLGMHDSLNNSGVSYFERCEFRDRHMRPERQDGTIFAVYVVTDGSTMWTYGRLFHSHNRPVSGAVTDPSDKFLGIYYLRNPETGGEYEVDVVTSLSSRYNDRLCPKCNEKIDRYALNGSLCQNCGNILLQANYES